MALKFQGSQFNAVNGTETTAIGEVISIGGPSGQASIIDATHSLSVAKEKLMGLPDEGQISLGLNLVLGDQGQNELLARRAAQTSDEYEIVFPDANTTKWTFNGFCLSFATDGSVDDKWTATANIEVDGPVIRA